MSICDHSGLTPSKAVRSMIHQTEIRPRQPESYRDLCTAVNRIGTNINQIARAANAQLATPNDIQELKAQMRKVYELVYQAMEH